MVERQAVIDPLIGRQSYKKEEFIPAMYGFIRTRQRWLYRLKSAGLRYLEKHETMARALGCPPPAILYEPRTFTCRQRFCPFCHARRVGGIYTQVTALSKQLKRDGIHHDVIRYRAKVKHDPLLLNPDGSIDYNFWTSVVPRHKRNRRRMRDRYFTDAFFGTWWLAFTPWYEQQPDAHGQWRTTHSAIAIVPTDWQKDARYGKMTRIATTEPKHREQIASAIASAFKYPTEWWVEGRARVTAHLFDLIHKNQLFTSFGPMRDYDEAERDLPDSDGQAQQAAPRAGRGVAEHHRQ